MRRQSHEAGHVARAARKPRDAGHLRAPAEFGIDIEDYTLVQEEAVTGEKLPTRYAWIIDAGTEKEDMVEVPNIPSILSALHDVGRRGIDAQAVQGSGRNESRGTVGNDDGPREAHAPARDVGHRIKCR
jgi:hypothetical protein